MKEGLLYYSQNGRINIRAHQPRQYFSMVCSPEEMSLNVGQLEVFNHCVAGLEVRIQRLVWHCEGCFNNVMCQGLLCSPISGRCALARQWHQRLEFELGPGLDRTIA